MDELLEVAQRAGTSSTRSTAHVQDTLLRRLLSLSTAATPSGSGHSQVGKGVAAWEEARWRERDGRRRGRRAAEREEDGCGGVDNMRVTIS